MAVIINIQNSLPVHVVNEGFSRNMQISYFRRAKM